MIVPVLLPQNGDLYVTWQNTQNVTIDGHRVTKTSGGTGRNAYASSVLSLGIGAEGRIRFTIPTGDQRFCLIGLSNDVEITDITDAEHVIDARNGTYEVKELNVSRFSGTFNALTDVFEVGIEGGAVKVWKNDVVVVTTPTSPTLPLYAILAFRDEDLYYENVIHIGGWQ